jgi:hypothetical protein
MLSNMKVLVLFGVLMVCVFTIALAGDEPWFDMVNCEMCKPLGDNPELLEHMSWEIFELSNGILLLSTVDKAYEEPYKKIGVAMQKVVDRIMAGEEVQLCNSCQAMNMIYSKQPKVENFVTQHGDVTVMTSDDLEVVAEMHAWAKRTNEELAKYEAEEMEEVEEHHDHDHDH